MGQCCSAKTKKSKKYRDNSTEIQKYNYLSDRAALNEYKDFLVYKINPSCAYTFLQRCLYIIAKENLPNQNISNPNKHIPQENRQLSQGKEQISKDHGLISKDNGQISNQNGQISNQNGQVSNQNGQIFKEYGQIFKEYEFLKTSDDEKSISFSQSMKGLINDQVENQMLKIIFDFKHIIIHNNSCNAFPGKESSDAISKLIDNFRSKNVKPKAIYILSDSNILERFKYLGELEQQPNNFVTPVMILDNEDIIYNTVIMNKKIWVGCCIYITSKKQYETNYHQYRHTISISTYIHLYSLQEESQIKDNNKNNKDKENKREYYYDLLLIQDKKKQEKRINEIREQIANCFQDGQDVLIVHENTDKKSISQVLIVIQWMLKNRLQVQNNDILSYWQHRLPKGIYDHFRQELVHLESEAKNQQLDVEIQHNQIIKQEQPSQQIYFSEINNSKKIELLLDKLFLEQKYDLELFEKAKTLVERLLQNITNSFDKKEFRLLNKQNVNLQCLFKYQYGMKLLNEVGFIDSSENIGFCQNMIDDIAYFKSVKSDFAIACKNFSQSETYIKQQQNLIQKKQKTS